MWRWGGATFLAADEVDESGVKVDIDVDGWPTSGLGLAGWRKTRMLDGQIYHLLSRGRRAEAEEVDERLSGCVVFDFFCSGRSSDESSTSDRTDPHESA